MKLDWTPLFAPGLIIAAGLALFAILGWGLFILRQRHVPQKWIAALGAIRAAIILLFLVCLLRPSIAWKQATTQGPALLVMVDSSRSMMTTDSPNGATRRGEVVSWMEGSGLADRLEGVSWFRFDQHAFQSERKDLEKTRKAVLPANYAKSLKAAYEQYRYEGGDDAGPVRVLLAGDGNDRGQDDVVETAQNLGLAIDVLAPLTVETAEEGGGSADITAVQSPRRVLLGSESRFLVTLRHQGLANRPLTLNLKQDGKVVATRQVQFAPNESEQQVDLVYRPVKTGFREYEVELSGFQGTHPTRVMTVEVVGARHEVLLLEDTWRWGFKYLRRVLENDPSFSFTGFLNRGGQVYVAFADGDRQNQLSAFPRTEADLNGFDIFVLGDVDPRHWAPGLAEGIHDMVVNKGKSLIVIAGPRIGSLAAVPELETLLPVALDPGSAAPLPGPIRIQVPPDARQSSFFQNAGTDAWENLPPVDQIYAPLHKKPAATILLQAPQLGNDFGRIIVAAEQTVGRGKVLYLGTDTLWKWQMSGADMQPGVTPYSLFWQQAFRALAPNIAGGQDGALSLKPDKTAYEVGERIGMRSRLISPPAGAEGQAQLRGTVKLPDGREVPVGFAPDPNKQREYIADLDASQPGSYTVTAEWIRDGRVTASVQTAIDVAAPPENEALAINQANLARIAAGTGGRVIDRSDKSTWPTPENLGKIPITKNVTVALWDNATLLVLLVLLMGADWAIRLKKGFV